MKYSAVIMRALICAILLAEAATSAVASDEAEKKSLQGIHGVLLTIDIDQGLEKYGLTPKQTRIDVEMRLRKAGIKVLDLVEWSREPGFPRLDLRLVAEKIDPNVGIWVYVIDLDLHQEILLKRNLQLQREVITWRTGSMGKVGNAKLDMIPGVIARYVDEFIDDYLAANPK